jgi:L,D-transpeptidase catalytic domain
VPAAIFTDLEKCPVRMNNDVLSDQMMTSYRRLTLAPSIAARLMCAVFALMALTTGALPAFAEVLISIDKRTQQMSVSVDGSQRYRFAVSTGRAGYGTPNGTYHPERLETAWFSKEYYNSPMPHSIFFHGGFAIHGSYEINRLGGPASHGCIRLHPANAATLFTLVKSEGMAATTIVVSGSNPVVARKPAPTAPPSYDGGTSLGYDNRYYRPDFGRPQPPGYSWPQEPSNFPFSNIY